MATYTVYQIRMILILKDELEGNVYALYNVMQDYPKDSAEYKEAEHDLEHDFLRKWLYDNVMSTASRKYGQSEVRFAGGDFLRSQIELFLSKEGL